MSNMKTMIVEDELIVAMDLESKLSRLGLQVIGVASTFQEAINRYEKYSPKAIFLDVNIRGDKTGIDVAREILVKAPETKLVFITAFSNEDTMDQIQELGAIGVIKKPFKDQQIAEIVEKIKAFGDED